MRTELKAYLPDENYKLLTYIVRFLEQVRCLASTFSRCLFTLQNYVYSEGGRRTERRVKSVQGGRTSERTYVRLCNSHTLITVVNKSLSLVLREGISN